MFFIPRFCPNTEKTFPNQTPILYGLSQYSSIQGEYTIVYVTGENFVYGTSKIGSASTNTEIIMIPINSSSSNNRTVIQTTFYSSNDVSFIVPTTLTQGTYKLYVSVKSTITGGSSAAVSGVTSVLFSNSVEYVII